MNKLALTSAIAVALVSTSSMAANVYHDDTSSLSIGGRAEFRGDFNGTSDGQDIEGTMDNQSRFRLNVAGETQIAEGVQGFGFVEVEQGVQSSADNTSQTTELKQRYVYAGVDTKFGAVSFGRQNTAGTQISDLSDFSTYSGGQKSFINAGDEQINNTIKYGFATDSLNLQASAILGDEKDTDGYGVSGVYSLPIGLDLGLGYAANGNGEGNGDANQIIAGAKYRLNALTLGATYTQGDIDDKDNIEFNGVELAAQYQITHAMSVTGAYQKQEVDNNGLKEDTSDFYELTGTYEFNNQMRTYAAMKFNNLDDASNSVRLGLRYDF
uniref:porin n=1 Tax=Thaumasiovibrio occultus TaxID=1891184 RepID=UPI000B358F63|nr:porin [Thaumasiovibrio occultus]